jgi:Bacterial mobilisation protein (MobC)
MGRYKRSYGGERRTILRTIPLTPSEDALIRSAAEIAGLKPTPYSRELLLRGAAGPRAEKAAPGDDRLLRVLEAAAVQARKIGNNLNQLTRMANRMGEITQIPELRVALARSCEIEELHKRALDHLLKARQ